MEAPDQGYALVNGLSMYSEEVRGEGSPRPRHPLHQTPRLLPSRNRHRRDLVFTTSIGTPIEPRNLSRHFEALRVRTKLRKVRFQDLRHSCASLLFELGVPLRMVMEILGHSQISTTSDIYTHVMPAQYREVADVLDAWLDGDGQAEEDGDEDAL